MVVTDDFALVTARAYPHMVLIQPAVVGDTITLSAPNMADLTLHFSQLRTLDAINSTLWSVPVKSVDCGAEVAKWLSQYIVHSDAGIRLVFYPFEKPSRTVKSPNTRYNKLSSIDTVYNTI